MLNLTLLDLLDSFCRSRVLVLGDVMLDRYIYGTIERISPEAPIPIIAIERSEDMPGGAANVVRNLCSLGAAVSLIGVVGDDQWGKGLLTQLARSVSADARLIVDQSRPTTVKTRYVADDQQVLRADRESKTPLSHELETRVLSEFESAIQTADIVVLSDYAKGVLSQTVVGAAISMASAAGKMILVDPKNKSFAKYRGATVLTPNRHELQAASGHKCNSDEEIVGAALDILREAVCDLMVVTRGKDGMTVVKADGDATHLRTSARDVFDVSGAGDTVVAALALGLAAGGNIVDAATVANIAAGIVVGKRGTAVVSTSEIQSALTLSDGHSDERNIFSTESVLRLARDWHEQGLKVAFTNGCFDLLHPGHVSLLEQARRSADRLIVGLNSDSSIARLKGPGRPVQAEIARATVLSSLKSVDAVAIFSQDTPLDLICALKPDVLVKGADYTIGTVVGADFVLQHGGRVILADLVQGHSTTNTLKRVASPGGK